MGTDLPPYDEPLVHSVADGTRLLEALGLRLDKTLEAVAGGTLDPRGLTALSVRKVDGGRAVIADLDAYFYAMVGRGVTPEEHTSRAELSVAFVRYVWAVARRESRDYRRDEGSLGVAPAGQPALLKYAARAPTGSLYGAVMKPEGRSRA